MELNADQELAALEGWAANGAVHPADRLTAALQVIRGMRTRERERVRAAVADTLRYARVNWGVGVGSERDLLDLMADAETLVRGWAIEPGWCCPFCEEVRCDDDCPLATIRKEVDADA